MTISDAPRNTKDEEKVKLLRATMKRLRRLHELDPFLKELYEAYRTIGHLLYWVESRQTKPEASSLVSCHQTSGSVSRSTSAGQRLSDMAAALTPSEKDATRRTS